MFPALKVLPAAPGPQEGDSNKGCEEPPGISDQNRTGDIQGRWSVTGLAVRPQKGAVTCR